MIDTDAEQRYTELRKLAWEIAARLSYEVDKLGFEGGEVMLQVPDDALYRLERDPSDGSSSLVGVWRDERGLKLGELLFHQDGTFHVEHDVALPHPHRRQCFVEAVSAWGKGQTIKSEPRLLAMPD